MKILYKIKVQVKDFKNNNVCTTVVEYNKLMNTIFVIGVKLIKAICNTFVEMLCRGIVIPGIICLQLYINNVE